MEDGSAGRGPGESAMPVAIRAAETHQAGHISGNGHAVLAW